MARRTRALDFQLLHAVEDVTGWRRMQSGANPSPRESYVDLRPLAYNRKVCAAN